MIKTFLLFFLELSNFCRKQRLKCQVWYKGNTPNSRVFFGILRKLLNIEKMNAMILAQLSPMLDKSKWVKVAQPPCCCHEARRYDTRYDSEE